MFGSLLVCICIKSRSEPIHYCYNHTFRSDIIKTNSNIYDIIVYKHYILTLYIM